MGWNKTYNALFHFFNGWFKLSNVCGGTQILEMVIFMDILAISEPILIKQRWFCHLYCMFFQIWNSVFHYLTKKLFWVAPSATELNYPFKMYQVYEMKQYEPKLLKHQQQIANLYMKKVQLQMFTLHCQLSDYIYNDYFLFSIHERHKVLQQKWTHRDVFQQCFHFLQMFNLSSRAFWIGSKDKNNRDL